MSQIIDRRLNGKNKSAVNRERFIRRFKTQIKKAVQEAVAGRSITDMEKGENVNIPARDLSEPVFRHGRGGRREIVHPGNREFVTGDKVDRPPEGGGSGSKAGNGGEGEDEFVFELSREEFMNFFFEDLELPDLVKTQLAAINDYKSVRAGFTTDGIPANLNVIRSLRSALARRIVLRSPHERRLREVEEQLERLADEDDDGALEAAGAALALRDEARLLRRRIQAVPFIDTLDLRYNNRIRQPQPTTQAVMFCLMDVSGSMDRLRKDIAKRFFILLYLFLQRNYERVQVVFIRHHTTASEVDEEAFFYSRETGGTVVSSALRLMRDIIRERYPTSNWNIYAAQASDGDNWTEDSPVCRELLSEDIMPCLQYFAYVEIKADSHQSLWREYETVKERFPNFEMRSIHGLTDIYPVFRQLFEKKART